MIYKDFGEYKIDSRVEAPRVKNFIDRPEEMTRLEQALLPESRPSNRQKIYVLRGLGGMGKTQLALEFATTHRQQFSSVFWLDGESKESLIRSVAKCVSRIPQDQIPGQSRMNNDSDESTVEKFMGWLAISNNKDWLLVFDNVDREYRPGREDADHEAYDVRHYFSGAIHGSILITTRLASLEQLGDSQHLTKVDTKQARAILESWYSRECGK